VAARSGRVDDGHPERVLSDVVGNWRFPSGQSDGDAAARGRRTPDGQARQHGPIAPSQHRLERAAGRRGEGATAAVRVHGERGRRAGGRHTGVDDTRPDHTDDDDRERVARRSLHRLNQQRAAAVLAARGRIADKKGNGNPYSTAEGRVPELIPVLGSQPAGHVSHKPAGRLPLLSARPAVALATLPISLLGEQRHNGCEQSRLRFEPRPFCA